MLSVEDTGNIKKFPYNCDSRTQNKHRTVPVMSANQLLPVSRSNQRLCPVAVTGHCDSVLCQKYVLAAPKFKVLMQGILMVATHLTMVVNKPYNL